MASTAFENNILILVIAVVTVQLMHYITYPSFIVVFFSHFVLYLINFFYLCSSKMYFMQQKIETK